MGHCMPFWRSGFYPLAVLAGALGASTTMPATFFYDNMIVLLMSLANKHIDVKLGGISYKSRYWLAATGSPATGKTPSLKPIMDSLAEMMKEAAELAPGHARDGFHFHSDNTTMAALCMRVVDTHKVPVGLLRGSGATGRSQHHVSGISMWARKALSAPGDDSGQAPQQFSATEGA